MFCYVTIMMGGPAEEHNSAPVKGKQKGSQKRKLGFKSLDFQAKIERREFMRECINDIEDTFVKKAAEIRKAFFSLKVFKPEVDYDYMRSTEYRQVNLNTLCDFYNRGEYMWFKPSPLEIEESIKKSIEAILL